MSGLDAEAVRSAVTGERFLAMVEALGGSLKGARRSPSDVRVPCFLHGGDGFNLALTPAKGLWHCHSGCGVGGDAIAMVERAQGVPFLQALAWLGAFAGMREGEASTWRPPEVAPVAPAVDTAPFMAALWACVADAPWSDRVAAWLEDERGVNPDAAYALGCRDWSTRRDAVRALLDATPEPMLEAAGLRKDGRSWLPLRGILAGDPAWAGVGVPAWRLGETAPARWRWRMVAPYPPRGGGELKAIATYGGGSDLLGMGRAPAIEGSAVRYSPVGTIRTLLVVEGEPDWWSAVEGVDGRAAVVAVCGSPSRWRPAWPTVATLAGRGVNKIVVCVHHGEPEADGRGHGERFAHSAAVECGLAGIACLRKLPAEGCDLNDLHKRGELREWLGEVLA